MIAADQIESLQAMSPGAAAKSDGTYDYVWLPTLKIEVGDEVRTLEALLALMPGAGYETRLFLSAPIGERPTINGMPANWTTHSVLGRNWHTWSWKDVPSSLPLVQILLAHVKALK